MTWYAAPNGSDSALGSIHDPLSLSAALTARIPAGATLYLRGGTYSGAYTVALNGTAAQPITIRNYPGELVIFDQNVNGNGAIGYCLKFGPQASYITLWGEGLNFRFTNSHPDRVTDVIGSDPTDVGGRGTWDALLDIRSIGITLINVVLHDGGNGLGLWEQAINGALYGVITFNNGWSANGGDRGHGHGFYIQNDDTSQSSQKTIRECLSFHNFATGMKAFGVAGHAQHVTWEGIIAFSAEVPHAIRTGSGVLETNILTRTDTIIHKNIVMHACRSYYPLGQGYNARSVVMGHTEVQNEDVTIDALWSAGGSTGLTINNFQSASVTNSRIFTERTPAPGDDERVVSVTTYDKTLPSAYAWAGNHYYGPPTPPTPAYVFACSGVVNEFGNAPIRFSGAVGHDWQTMAAFDSAPTWQTAKPSTNWVDVRPNAYEHGRAHIVIYNWENLSSVAVDLSAVLSVGDAFVILHATELFGSPFVAGVYDGSPVSIPMTDTASAASPIGYEAYPIPSTLPLFGAFVVLVTA